MFYQDWTIIYIQHQGIKLLKRVQNNSHKFKYFTGFNQPFFAIKLKSVKSHKNRFFLLQKAMSAVYMPHLQCLKLWQNQ